MSGQPENDEDINDVMRTRTSREEVRRRNREIMERANAELREGRAPTASAPKPVDGRKEFSRLGLIKKAREGSQTFWSDYRFFNYVPDIDFGAVREDLRIDGSKFSEFDASSFEQLFMDCLKSTCLVDPASIAYLDLVNQDEAYPVVGPLGSALIDPLDEALLSNELVSNQADKAKGDVLYTGHFLRKPQLMSNDLFTEGMQAVGGRDNYGKSLSSTNENGSDDFATVELLDKAAASGSALFNPITKREMKPLRVLPILPDLDLGSSDFVQVKFDERLPDNDISKKYILDSSFTLLETVDDATVYKKKRKFIQTNKVMAGNDSSENCYLLRSENGVCKLRPVANKVILKKQMNSTGDEFEIHLNKIDQDDSVMSQN